MKPKLRGDIQRASEADAGAFEAFEALKAGECSSNHCTFRFQLRLLRGEGGYQGLDLGRNHLFDRYLLVGSKLRVAPYLLRLHQRGDGVARFRRRCSHFAVKKFISSRRDEKVHTILFRCSINEPRSHSTIIGHVELGHSGEFISKPVSGQRNITQNL